MLKKEKPKEVNRILETVKGYPVIGVVSMHKLPARQLQDIKQMLMGKAVITIAKKRLILMAFQQMEMKGLEKLKEKIEKETALILTEANPFRIYRDVEKVKSPAPAKAGDTAPRDIEIKAGPTDLPPGPAITMLQKVGLKTKVDAGKIAVLQDKVVCKKGETVTPEMANVFNALKIQPMEIGLKITALLEDGVVYERDVLAIDEEQYMEMVSSAISDMINLSINSCYPVIETAELMVQKAYMEMKSLGIEAGIIEKDVIEELLAKAGAEANGVEASMKKE